MTSRSVSTLSLPDYLVFGTILLVSAGIGVVFAIVDRCSKNKSANSVNNYLMASKSMGPLPISLSLLASFMSAITLLGTPSEMYIYGTVYWWIAISYLIVVIVSNSFYIPVFYELQITSSYEYLGLRFHRCSQILSAAVFVIQMTTYMGMVLYTPSLALSAVTGLNVWISVFSVGLVCTFYTTLGGIKAVMWTDVFQMIMMFAGLIAIITQGSVNNDGFYNVWHIADKYGRIKYVDWNIAPHHRHTIWSLIIGGTFTWLSIYGCNQTMVQRALTAKNLFTAKLAFYMNAPGLSALLSVCCLCGLVVIAQYITCDPLLAGRISEPDQLLPLFVMDNLSFLPGLPGLFTACLFSGALSTVSSGLNSLAAVCLHDLVMRCYPNIRESRASILTKVLAFAFGGVSLLFAYIASKLGQILQAALGAFGMLGGPVLGVFTLGLFFPMANWKGAVVGHVVAQIIVCWIGFGFYIYGVKPEKLPVYTHGCDNTTILVNKTATPYDPDAIPYPYKTSYMWYSAISVGIVILVGLIVSALTGFNGEKRTKSKYISPVLRPLWRKFSPESHFSIDDSEDDKSGENDQERKISHSRNNQNIFSTETPSKPNKEDVFYLNPTFRDSVLRYYIDPDGYNSTTI